MHTNRASLVNLLSSNFGEWMLCIPTAQHRVLLLSCAVHEPCTFLRHNQICRQPKLLQNSAATHEQANDIDLAPTEYTLLVC